MPARLILCCIAWCMVAACDSQPANPVDATMTIRAMTFNIEWGGEHVSFDNVIETIRRSEASIVGIQEAEGNLERIADALDWHFNLRNYVISAYPLLDPPDGHGRYVFVEVSPGRIVALANLHLPSDPYGPDLVRDGEGLEAVLNNEGVRLMALRPYLQVLPSLADRRIPVLVTGDFNSPAHTDWTPALVGERPFIRYPVAWPVSLAMTEAGFEDTWRAVYPDPLANPGLTWWAGRPPLEAYAPNENDAEDRIDYIWFAGPARPEAVWIAGETGGPEVTLEVSPWPSDHRAVYADFTVTPFPVPDLVTTDRRVYTAGDEMIIAARFSKPGDATVSIIDMKTGDALFSDDLTAPSTTMRRSAPGPGEYVVKAANNKMEFERSFWVLPADAMPEVAAEHAGATVTVRWRNAPGNRNDYIALYKHSNTDLIGGILAYVYVDAMPHGAVDIGALLDTVSDSTRSGTYVVRLLKDDGYDVLAESAAFTLP